MKTKYQSRCMAFLNCLVAVLLIGGTSVAVSVFGYIPAAAHGLLLLIELGLFCLLYQKWMRSGGTLRGSAVVPTVHNASDRRLRDAILEVDSDPRQGIVWLIILIAGCAGFGLALWSIVLQSPLGENARFVRVLSLSGVSLAMIGVVSTLARIQLRALKLAREEKRIHSAPSSKE